MSRVPLRSEISAAQGTLEAAGVPGARADAEILAADLLRVPRTKLGLHPLVDDGFVERFRALVDRRATRIPLQHLLGTAHLAGVDVAVGPGVFIPRPETESLVVWALDAIAGVRSPLVVDLFTGSAAIALAIATARPDARVIGVERSPGALAWARRNTESHRDAGGTPVELRGVDVFDIRGLADLDGAVDLVTANPPYVPVGTPVEPEVGEHDPAEAVFAGPDGLDVIRPLVAVVAGLLRVDGVLAVEHDDTHGESVPALLRARRILTDVTAHTDLAGRPRFVSARRVALPAR
ncbi:peptide chain release factor N(5)-glutamine methyltransferase [Nakamurella flavida]|uniref:Release factor glutamine methyltransferase n=1 Tax=Nakamurella flavida TaxID=363630 RepID=A0A938YH27_9ACTN|nr:peptide chain release factor N(5)-glutamine methyltransferase [Nakamurella flavida]MBM9474939.1 peptide chain release factor N(5)-glutamine methyltransferase [Nakamurella flavida]MDP9776508.1 release factor glutamine methyltransferase [Nakamurella flavida]